MLLGCWGVVVEWVDYLVLGNFCWGYSCGCKDVVKR